MQQAVKKGIWRLRDFVKPNGFSRRKFNIIKKKKKKKNEPYVIWNKINLRVLK